MFVIAAGGLPNPLRPSPHRGILAGSRPWRRQRRKVQILPRNRFHRRFIKAVLLGWFLGRIMPVLRCRLDDVGASPRVSKLACSFSRLPPGLIPIASTLDGTMPAVKKSLFFWSRAASIIFCYQSKVQEIDSDFSCFTLGAPGCRRRAKGLCRQRLRSRRDEHPPRISPVRSTSVDFFGEFE